MTPTDADLQDAWIWELLHRGHRGDKAYYRRACRGSRAILELGCGYGRLLPFLSETGASVVGLERHPGLLARAAERVAALPPRRAARVSLVEGDMRGPLPLGPAGPFDRILIPYNGLFCLLAPGEQLACLKAARAVAAPDCHLLLDAYVIDEAALDPSPPGEGAADENEHVLTVLTPEGRVEVYEQNFEAPGQRIDALYTLELTDDAGETRTLTQRIGHKFLLPREVEPLLTEAGWRTIGFHGGFRGAKFTDRSALMVITAENPGGAPHHP